MIFVSRVAPVGWEAWLRQDWEREPSAFGNSYKTTKRFGGTEACCARVASAMNIAAYVAYFLIGLLAGIVLPSFAMSLLG
jgi:hypothetical protein